MVKIKTTKEIVDIFEEAGSYGKNDLEILKKKLFGTSDN